MAERRANRIRKGAGGEGKALSPDAFDHYQYEFSSLAFLTLRFADILESASQASCEIVQLIEENHAHFIGSIKTGLGLRKYMNMRF
jgi:hypothetical protein